MITASIVLYNNDQTVLKEAIDSFLNSESATHLYLVDNSPSDELRILGKNQNITYLHYPENLGFGAAHNIAIKKSLLTDNSYHLILNPDVYFDPIELDKMIAFMEQDIEIGQLMPKVTFPNGDLQYLCKRNPTMFDLFARRFMPGFLKTRFKKRMDLYEYRDHDYKNTIYDVPYLSGCFMLLRNEILKRNEILFDEKIFMYIEDADLTRRILEVSKTVYYPFAHIYHHYGKGSYNNFKLMKYNIDSALYYFKKWK